MPRNRATKPLRVAPEARSSHIRCMITMELVRELYAHMEWADATVWKSVESLDLAETDSRLRDLLAHTHMTQQAFLLVWTEQPFTYKEPTDFPTLQSIRQWATPYYGQSGAFLDSIDESKFGNKVDLPWLEHFEKYFGKPAIPANLGETLLQVPLHTQYHRAQINTRIKELGGQPNAVDYIAWVWLGRPTLTMG